MSKKTRRSKANQARIDAYIARAQASGSTATTLAGAGRWILAHVTARPLDRIAPKWLARHDKRAHYERTRWVARIDARADRVARKLGKWSLADAEVLASNLTTPYLRHAETALMAQWPYRQSESSWAGGQHSVTVRIGDPSASCITDRVWSDNGKWSGTNSHATITTDLATLLAFPTLQTRDGLVLCRAEKIGTREYKVLWIEQSTGVSLKPVDGYLIRGYHVRAPGIVSARKKAASARQAALSSTVRARQDARTKRAKLAGYRSMWISVEDSISAGNCKPATDQFARAMWDKLGASGPCAVRADVVLATRDDSYVRRAIGHALTREHAMG